MSCILASSIGSPDGVGVGVGSGGVSPPSSFLFTIKEQTALSFGVSPSLIYPLAVAVNVEMPSFKAVTTPLLVIVATDGSLLVQFTRLLSALFGKYVTLICPVSPSSKVNVVLSIDIEVTGVLGV